ncbi:glycosyltransferase [Caproicibacterium lactatifermentans]|jgi:glycosyltransferase involved in cell wall biosynthesis|uniref:Glycosyltransferase n=1 Tax=Caproicibacterium lactatifermentans TaxID=2666138 RepID=A0ABX6PX89_9FIRM|nr:glycosyltransferase [Caproicibacterium lactatifermentans]QKO30903.1 glycosyltransferase [Caproicibacterium lactatifermentans]
MPKKKILFINYSLHSGGIEKSLVTLLTLFDYDQYDVDLQLFANDGLFLPRVPKQVHLLPPLFPKEYRLNIRQALPALLKNGHPLTALCRAGVTCAGLHGTMGERLVKMWRCERCFVRKNPVQYDAAVAYMEGQPIYYCIDDVHSRRKIGFVHGDYTAMGLDRAFDTPYFAKLDAVCTVSESCKTALQTNFPQDAQKCHVQYNLLSSSLLRQMAEEPAAFPDSGYTGLRVLSIARLSQQKGLDLALPAVAALRRKGLDFRWYIIGVGPEKESLLAQIQKLGLQKDVVFLGEQANPYPFVRACDIYMQPSRFEGKSIAVDEAMALSRPILLTDFSTAKDQIADGKTGLIVPMSPEGISNGLERLLTNASLRQSFSAELAAHDYSNMEEIRKFYAILNGSRTAEPN